MKSECLAMVVRIISDDQFKSELKNLIENYDLTRFSPLKGNLGFKALLEGPVLHN
jgi:hypothetical protein